MGAFELTIDEQEKGKQVLFIGMQDRSDEETLWTAVGRGLYINLIEEGERRERELLWEVQKVWGFGVCFVLRKTKGLLGKQMQDSSW